MGWSDIRQRLRTNLARRSSVSLVCMFWKPVRRWWDVSSRRLFCACNHKTSFISCVAGEDGGGLYLYQTHGRTNVDNIPVNSCRFIGCTAKGVVTRSSENQADGGGLMYWTNYCTLGLTDSVFSNCESKKRGGAMFLAINSNPFNHIVRFCFFSVNTAQKGRNALVHFNGSSTNDWAKVLFHSFTSDNTLTNSLVQNYSNADPVNTIWLPLTNINVDLPSVGTSNLETSSHNNNEYINSLTHSGVLVNLGNLNIFFLKGTISIFC